jgi:hypothetical protein
LPIVFPCAALLLLVGWRILAGEPRIRADRDAHQPLVSLEEQISTLRLKCSDQEARAAAAQASELSGQLLSGSGEAAAVLGTLAREAQDRQWVATFKPAAAWAPAPEGAQIAFLPVRAALAPAPGNAQPFSTLLALLAQVPHVGKRIDFTRLSIHADEPGQYVVQANFRLFCRAHP